MKAKKGSPTWETQNNIGYISLSREPTANIIKKFLSHSEIFNYNIPRYFIIFNPYYIKIITLEKK